MKLPSLNETTMSLTLPTELLQKAQMTEAQMLREIAIMLYQQQRLQLEQAAELTVMAIDDFYQLLVSRNIITPPTDSDDDPNELILASLRISLQQAKEGKVHPISELWDGIDD
jgi:predicted HTH domain antitoxin